LDLLIIKNKSNHISEEGGDEIFANLEKKAIKGANKNDRLNKERKNQISEVEEDRSRSKRRYEISEEEEAEFLAKMEKPKFTKKMSTKPFAGELLQKPTVFEDELEGRNDYEEEEDIPATRLTKSVVDKLQTFAGLILQDRKVDEDGMDGSIWEPTNEKVMMRVIKYLKYLDFDPVIQMTPATLLSQDLKVLLFQILHNYSTQLSQFCRNNPFFRLIPIVPGLPVPAPVNLNRYFRSALVAFEYMILRIQNGPEFAHVPVHTFLGELQVTYGGIGHMLLIGPYRFTK